MDPIITVGMGEWLKTTVLQKTPTDFGHDQLTWTRGILAALLEKTFGIHVTEATVGNHLRKMGLTVQVPEYKWRGQEVGQVAHFLHETYPRIKRLANKMGADIGFEDEAGFDLREHHGTTWGLRGHPPVVRVTNKRGRLNALSIITLTGKLHFSLEEKDVDGQRFVAFLKQVLEQQGQPLILILDRASFYTSKLVKDFVRSHRKKIRVYFFPKYSPELNPDEQVWNELKNNHIR